MASGPSCMVKVTYKTNPHNKSSLTTLHGSITFTKCFRTGQLLKEKVHISSSGWLLPNITKPPSVALYMELPVANDGIHLSAYRPKVSNGKTTPGGFDETGYYNCYDDGNSITTRGSLPLTGYETLDAPPHYDFYANTEVWGRRRRFRPSLFQLHANPEVKQRHPTALLLTVKHLFLWCTSWKSCVSCVILWF